MLISATAGVGVLAVVAAVEVEGEGEGLFVTALVAWFVLLLSKSASSTKSTIKKALVSNVPLSLSLLALSNTQTHTHTIHKLACKAQAFLEVASL